MYKPFRATKNNTKVGMIVWQVTDTYVMRGRITKVTEDYMWIDWTVTEANKDGPGYTQIGSLIPGDIRPLPFEVYWFCKKIKPFVVLNEE